MSFVAIGDIHGCVRTLRALLLRVAPRPDDHLVFLGDYVDRGPDSRGVIDRLLELEASPQPCTFLRGNHEEGFLDFLKRGRSPDWLWYGGTQTLDSYRDAQGKVVVPPEHESFLARTTLYFDAPEHLFVHAGLQPHLSVAANLQRPDPAVMLYGRSHLRATHLAWEKPVVFGHTPRAHPLIGPQMIAIDTGCVYPHRQGLGRLTAVRLPEGRLYTAAYCG